MKNPIPYDWDDAFANMAHVPGSQDLPELWGKNAANYRNSDVRIQEISYGQHPREQLDIIWPNDSPKGLAVFVHGGYWMKFDKSFWSDLAEGARASQWAVCIPSYTLAPEARITSITLQIGKAITTAAALVDGPIKLAGHSAGGHLVTRMVCGTSPLDSSISSRIEHCLSISGLHDLRPLLHTQMNKTLQLDLEEATRESAVLQLPLDNLHYCAWVGGNERPEFIRQSQLVAQMWEGLDAKTQCVIDAQHNHFSIIEGLKFRDSAITQAFINS